MTINTLILQSICICMINGNTGILTSYDISHQNDAKRNAFTLV